MELAEQEVPRPQLRIASNLVNLLAPGDMLLLKREGRGRRSLYGIFGHVVLVADQNLSSSWSSSSSSFNQRIWVDHFVPLAKVDS